MYNLNVRNFWRQLEINLCESCGYSFKIKWVKDALFDKLGATPVLTLEILCGKYFIHFILIKN